MYKNKKKQNKKKFFFCKCISYSKNFKIEYSQKSMGNPYEKIETLIHRKANHPVQ